MTRTVARTFAPDLSYHMDFPCPLLWVEPGQDALSLAEILEQAEAVFEIWHQSPAAGYGTGKLSSRHVKGWVACQY